MANANCPPSMWQASRHLVVTRRGVRQRFLTGAPQELFKHALPNYLVRGTDLSSLSSLRLSNTKNDNSQHNSRPWPQLASQVLSSPPLGCTHGQGSAGFSSAYFGSLPKTFGVDNIAPSLPTIPVETMWPHQKAFEGELRLDGGLAIFPEAQLPG